MRSPYPETMRERGANSPLTDEATPSHTSRPVDGGQVTPSLNSLGVGEEFLLLDPTAFFSSSLFPSRLLGPCGAARATGHAQQGRPKEGWSWAPVWCLRKWESREPRGNRIESHQTLQAFALNAPLPGALSPQTVFWPSHPPLMGFSP